MTLFKRRLREKNERGCRKKIFRDLLRTVDELDTFRVEKGEFASHRDQNSRAFSGAAAHVALSINHAPRVGVGRTGLNSKGDSIVTDLHVHTNGNGHNCLTSSSLLDLARAMDSEAWNRVYRLYRPLVQSWCRGFGLQESDMAEIVQEVFCAAFRNLHSFRRDAPGQSFRKWLKTIARNEVANHWRRKRKFPNPLGGSDAIALFGSLPDQAQSQEIEQAEAESEKKLLLRRMLDIVRAETEQRRWKAFWSSTIEGKQASEIAESLDVTTNFVYLAKSRTLRRFRELYSELVGD